MGILSRLFGFEGRIRFEGIDRFGKIYVGKTTISCVGMSREEIEEELKKIFFVEKGIKVESVRILEMYKT